MPKRSNLVAQQPRQLISAIGLLYETLERPELWPPALESCAGVLRAPLSAMIFHDSRCGEAAVQISTGMTPEARQEYNSHYGLTDVWFAHSAHLTAGWSGRGNELVPEHEVRRTEFYNDYLRRYQMLHQCGTVLMKDELRFSTVTFVRREDQPLFQDVDIEYLRTLTPHLQRVLGLRTQMYQLKAGMEGLQKAFDCFDQAVFGLTEGGPLLFMNQRATAMVGAGKTLFLRDKRLRLRDFKDDAKLQAMILAVSDRGACAFAGAGGGLITHDEKGVPVHVVLMPFLGSSGSTSALAALVFVNSPLQRTASRMDLLRVLYRLTPTEARLVDQLAAGLCVKAIAEQMDVSQETARFHLKNVFRKTNLSRQSDLVRLVLLLPAGTA